MSLYETKPGFTPGLDQTKFNFMTQEERMQELIRKETEPKNPTHWGTVCPFTPVICDTIIGDGMQLAYLGTTGQRPYWWLIRIDSKTDVEADNFDYEMLLEHLEECFGRMPDYMHEEEFNECLANDSFQMGDEGRWDSYAEFEETQKYPYIGWDGGHWGSVAIILPNGRLADED